VREAVDFLRYYAAQARNHFANDTHRPLGPVVCISPWNFPLAIFSGQVARRWPPAIRCWPSRPSRPPDRGTSGALLLEAAFPPVRCNCCRAGRDRGCGAGRGRTGARRDVHRLHRGGGHHLRNLAGRLDAQGRTILIAETGGQNAMIVDSSA
jgi:RHH-type proline utilization regulon transcriptional repressor/proline dehydrogenase/delta 1-pyrroline-5-carboxylate dehydrogenase